MPARRRIFNEQYGSAKTEQSKGGGPLPPPQTQAPVPLSLQPQQAQGQAQGSSPPLGVRIGDSVSDSDSVPPDLNELLRRLFAQFGGANGPAA